ncbi:integral membrane protein [Rutstroemia sp. NJR-2017a BVV2]|nr:integral membrane protein [Rutstroemia sp. NJR-2017a BVV2]
MAPLSAPGQSAPGQSRAIGILCATVIFTILPPVFVALRLWARKLKSTPLALNDYFIMIAAVLTTGFDINTIYCSTNGGFGQHITRMKPTEVIALEKGFFIATTLWPSANTFVKLSILDFYYRTFPNRRFRIAVWTLMGAATVYGLATIVTAFTICRPLPFNWDKTIPTGKCGDINAYYLWTGIVNLLVDVCVVTLPMPIRLRTYPPG